MVGGSFQHLGAVATPEWACKPCFNQPASHIFPCSHWDAELHLLHTEPSVWTASGRWQPHWRLHLWAGEWRANVVRISGRLGGGCPH